MATNTLPSGGASRISLADIGQLIASLPPIVGFCPADSLVAIGLVGPAGKQIGPVVRLDLPPPEKEDYVRETLTALFAANQVKAVALVVIGEHESQRTGKAELPHGDLIELLHAAWNDSGPEIEHALWTPKIRGGSVWACYEDTKCRGVVPDETSTPMAAAAAAAGYVTFRSRQELEQLLAPDDPAAVRRVGELLTKAIDEIDPSADPERLIVGYAADVRVALAQVKRAEAVANAGPDFSDDQVARLALALSHTRIRDACLAMALSPSESVRRHTERFVLELVRRVPEPERTEPAGVLAYVAYLRGDGALATIAVDVALAANPGNTLAGLLNQCLVHGMAPGKLRALGQVETLDELCGRSGSAERGDS